MDNRMRKVYIAGPYSADNVMDVLRNIKNGNDTAAWLILQGFAVFSPFLDFQYALTTYGKDITKAQYQAKTAWPLSIAATPCWSCLGGRNRAGRDGKWRGPRPLIFRFTRMFVNWWRPKNE